MELLKKRIANLLCVKSIVTIVLTGVFAYMAVIGNVSSDQFLTIFTMVIGFYFGVQAEKKATQVVEQVAQTVQTARMDQKEQAPNG